MIHSQQLLLSPLRPKRPLPPHPQPKPLSFPSRESRMMIQRISHPQPLLFLDVEFPHPQEEAVKSLIRVPPILFYGLSYDGYGDVCRVGEKFFCKNAIYIWHIL